MSEPADPFISMLESYKTAVFEKNVDAFVALYDDDVYIFDMWNGWSLRGIDAWRRMAAEWFSSLGTECVVVDIADAQSTVSGAFSFGHAILTFTAVSAEGEELRSLSNRVTMVIKHTGRSWKIQHEHTSSPVDHGTLKAVLQYSGNH